MISANILNIDIITSNIAAYIQEELDDAKTSTVKMPLGSFTGTKYFSGIGPNISLKIASTGNIDTDLRSEFIAQGINQTIHRIYLQIDCEVSVLTPINTLQENIQNQVLLAENVIVGQIPSSYYNLEGFNNAQDTLEMTK